MKAVAKCMAMALGLAAGVGLTGPALAQEADGPILFTNVNVFDGVNETLIRNYSLK